ncbi:MAG: murein biosynthesis integral membrane protein MurJ [Clostridia bacterium]|nr:murein biosynthesis integral membrane protein MurJ [Clostridia bacterium]
MEDAQKKRLTGAAVIVMSSIIVSRITGFLREALIPNMLTVRYGVDVSDAYNMAFRVTDIMYNMLVGGTIAAALIPVLTGYIQKKQEEEGWKAVSTFINVIFIGMLIACTLGIIFAPQLVPVIAYGFKKESSELTIKLARILFPSVGFMMLAGLTNGVLNSYQRFAAAAYGPSIYNIGGALSLLLLSRYGVEAVTYGVLASAILYFLFQLSFALKNLKYYRLKIYFKNEGFRRLFKLAIPSLLSSSIVQVNVLITAGFVSTFEKGAITAFNMADKIWQMPLGIFAQGIGMAILPAMSAKLAVGELENFKNLLMKGLKNVLLISVPSAVGLIVLNFTIIRTLMQFTKKLDENVISNAANILVFFSIALLSQSVCAIINRAFYANNDTKTPLYIGGGSIVINIILSQILRSTYLGIAGMTLSYSISSAINAILLLVILNKKMNGIYVDKLIKFLIKVVPASVFMGGVLWYVNNILPVNLYPKLIQVSILSFEVMIGAVIYFGIALLMKVEEAAYMRDVMLSRLKKLTKIFSS